jgi:hypothetical protein
MEPLLRCGRGKSLQLCGAQGTPRGTGNMEALAVADKIPHIRLLHHEITTTARLERRLTAERSASSATASCWAAPSEVIPGAELDHLRRGFQTYTFPGGPNGVPGGKSGRGPVRPTRTPPVLVGGRGEGGFFIAQRRYCVMASTWSSDQPSGSPRSPLRSPVLNEDRLRCAIYTRVSTDHGLEQDFNSLDAQREAAEAYVTSPSCRSCGRNSCTSQADCCCY